MQHEGVFFNFTGLIAPQYGAFKLLNTYIAKLNACAKMPEEVCFMYLGIFKTCCVISVLFSTKYC